MRIALYSDLHLDHDAAADAAFLNELQQDDSNPDSDVAVIAGDLYSVASPKLTTDFIQIMLDRYPHVLFVPGNHDYWLANPENFVKQLHDEVNNRFDDVTGQRVHLATEPRYFQIGGQRFLAGTLWYPEPGPRQQQQFIDMRQTKVYRNWFFEQFQEFMDVYRHSSDLSDTVVVTHHLPAPESTPTQFKGSPYNHFFCTDLTKDILEKTPKAWLHGHTHDACDYMVGQTRVVCNPRGYPHEYKTRAKYEPKLIEV